MYGKSCELDSSQSLFTEASNTDFVKDITIWTALTAAYGKNGKGAEALQLLEQMEKIGVVPDAVYFVALLDACNHSGLPERAVTILESMEQKYHIVPTAKHVACVVDGVARKGLLEEASLLIKKWVIKEEDKWIPYMSLLSSCRLHGDITRAENAFAVLKSINPLSAPICIFHTRYTRANLRAPIRTLSKTGILIRRHFRQRIY